MPCRRTTTGQPAPLRAAPSPGFRVAAPTGTAPLLPKDRSEQSLVLGLFFSVGTLGCGCYLAWLLAASAADDLV